MQLCTYLTIHNGKKYTHMYIPSDDTGCDGSVQHANCVHTVPYTILGYMHIYTFIGTYLWMIQDMGVHTINMAICCFQF